MPDLNEILKSREEHTLEESLKSQLKTSIARVSTNTIPNGRIDTTSTKRQPVSQAIEKTAYKGIGSNLWDFTREATQQFVDTAAFGIPSAFTDFDPGADVDTTAEKIGQAVGGAAGFLVPFKGVSKFVVNPIARAIAGASGTKKLNKTIMSIVNKAGEGKGALSFTDDAAGVVKESENIVKLFDSSVSVKFGNIVKIFNKLDPAQKAKYAKKLGLTEGAGAGKIVKEMAERKGIKLSQSAADEITEKVGLAWMKSGGRPVNNLQGLFAKKTGDGKIANFYGHLFEEGVIFTGVETGMHAIQVMADKEDAHFGKVATDAFLLGHAFGLVRFIPGGLEGGLGVNPIFKGGRDKLRFLFTSLKSYGKKYNPKIQKDRENVTFMYDQYKRLGSDDIYGGAAAYDDILTWASKKKWDGKMTYKGERVSLEMHNLSKIIKNGTEAEKEMATRYMQDALQYVGRNAQSIWRKEFSKAFGKDILQSSVRMAAGGAVMTGPEVLFNEDIPFEDKLIHFTMGAFLMKQGKVLKYKNSDGSYGRYSGLHDWSPRIKKVKLTLDTIGTDIYTSDGNIDPLWLTIHLKAAAADADSGKDYIQSFSNPEHIQDMLDTAATKFATEGDKKYHSLVAKYKKEALSKKPEDNKKLSAEEISAIEQRAENQTENYVFQTDSNNPIKPHTRQSTLDLKQSFLIDRTTGDRRLATTEEMKKMRDEELADNEGIVEESPDVDSIVYQSWARSLSKNEVLGESRRFKEWKELSPNEKKMWKESMDSAKIPTTKSELGIEKLETMFVQANLSRWQDAIQKNLQTAIDAAGAIEIDGAKLLKAEEIIDEKSGKRYYKFKYIDYSNADITSAQSAAIREYNSLIELITMGGLHQVKTERFNDVKLVSSGKGFTGIKAFTERMNKGISEMNEALDILPRDAEGNPIPDSPQTSYVDSWLHRLQELQSMEVTMEHTSRELPKYLDAKLKEAKTELGLILKDTLIDGRNGYMASKITVKDSANSKKAQALESYVNNVLDIVIIKAPTRTSQNVKEITITEAKALKDAMAAEGFKVYTERLVIDNGTLSSHIQRRVLTDHLENSKKNVNGKIVDLTTTDIRVLQEGLDAGIINRNLTFNPVVDVMLQTINKKGFDKIFKEFEKNGQVKTFEEIIEIVETSGDLGNADKGELIKLINNYRATNPTFEGVELLQDLRFINNKYKQYLKSPDNSQGVIHPSQEDFVAMNPDMIVIMKGRLFQAKYNAINTGTKTFLNRIGELNKEEIKFNQKLVNTIQRELQYSSNPITIMQLLTARGFYSVKEDKFLELSDTQVVETIKAIREQSRNDWFKIDEQLAHEEQLTDLISKEEQLNHTTDTNPVRMSKILIDNKPSGVWKSGEPEISDLQHLKNLWYSSFEPQIGKAFKDAKAAQLSYMKSLKENLLKNNKNLSDADVTSAINKWFNDVQVTKNHNIITVNAADSQKSSYDEGIHKDNLIFSGVSDIQNGVHGVTLVKGQVVVDGAPKTISELMDTVTAILFKPDKIKITPSKVMNMDHVGMSRQLQGQSSVVYKVGVNKTAFVIKYSQSNMDRIATNYAEYLKEIVDNPNIKFTEDNRQNLLLNKDNNGFGKITYDADTKLYKMELLHDHSLANDRIYEIMNDYVIGKALKDVYWNNNLRDSKDKRLGELVKRIPLFGNVSSTNFNKSKVLSSSDFLKDSSLNMVNKRGVVKFLKDLGEEKINEVVIADENVDGSDINGAFSVRKLVNQQFQNALVDIKANKELSGEEKSSLLKEVGNQIREFSEIADASTFNGVTFVSPEAFGALAYLGGNSRHVSAGGVKPIILGYHNGQVFVQKTAMLKNKQMDTFFAQNPDVGFVSFTSASKKIGGEYHQDYKIIDGSKWDNGNLQVDSEFKRIMQPESINIISVKGDKGHATLGRNHSTHIQNPDARNDFYNKWHKKGIEDLWFKLSGLKNMDNDGMIKAEFRRLMMGKVKDSSGNFEIEKSTLGVYASWAEAGGMPQLFSRQWADLLFNKHIKRELNKQVNGAQGVMGPDFMGELKNTLVVDSKVYDVGETEIGWNNRDKTIEMKNITLVKNNKGNFDEVINFNEVNKDLKEFQAAVEALSAGQRTLGKVYDILKDIQKYARKGKRNITKYEIGVSVERFPHTKPSSVFVNSLKGFRDKSEGNVVILNNADVKRAAEGDYDIDTANVMWESPSSVMKEYLRGRAEVQDSKALKTGDNMSYTGKTFKNRLQMVEMTKLADKAEGLRGTIMNYQSLVQQLQSHVGLQGFEYRNNKNELVKETFVAQITSNLYLTLNPNLRNTHQLIADYIQATLDSSAGYNTDILNFENIHNEIMYGKDGIFVIKKMADKVRTTKKGQEEIVNKELVEVADSNADGHRIDLAAHPSVQAIIKHIIDPYRRLLNASTKIYDNNSERTVGHQDMLQEIYRFDKSMRNAEIEAKKEFKVTTTPIPSIFHGWADAAQLGNNPNGPIYNRLLTEIQRLGDLGLRVNETYVQDRILGEEVNKLYIEHVSDAIRTQEGKEPSETTDHSYNDFVKDQFKASETLNYLESQIESSYKLLANVGKDSPNGRSDRKYYETRIKDLKKIKDKISKKLDKHFMEMNDDKTEYKGYIAKQMVKRWEDKLTREEIDKRKKSGKDFEPLNGKDVARIRKEAKRKLAKNGIVIEGAAKGDVINALALQDMFGTFSIEFVKDLGMDIQAAKLLDTDISNIRKEFNAEVTDMVQKKWKNQSWDNAYADFVQRIELLVSKHGGSEAMSNVILAKIMAPKMDITRLVSHKGRLYPKPEHKRMDSFVLLGMKYWQQRYTKSDPIGGHYLYMEKVNKLATLYNKTQKKLNGNMIDKNGDPIQFQDYYMEPLHYNGMKKDALLQAFKPDYQASLKAGYAPTKSRLDAYQQLHHAFGSGMMRDIIRDDSIFTLPHAAIVTINGHSSRISLDGVAGFQSAFNKGIRSVLISSDNATYMNTDSGNLNTDSSHKDSINLGRDINKPSNRVKEAEEAYIEEWKNCL